MEYLTLKAFEHSQVWNIDGIEGPAKVIPVRLAASGRLRHLVRHKADLLKIDALLQYLDRVSTETTIARALVEHCIVIFGRCYLKSKKRFRLAEAGASLPPDLLATAEALVHVRHKEIAHDNDHTNEVFVGAVVNLDETKATIERIVAIQVKAQSISAVSVFEFRRLVSTLLQWIEAQINIEMQNITEILERRPRISLLSQRSLKGSVRPSSI
jgi:hypothetical protein